MTPDEMKVLLAKQPFEPFQIFVDDGQTYPVRSPRVTRIGGERFFFGVFDKQRPETEIADYFMELGWPHIVRWEFLSAGGLSRQGDGNAP